eukprot:TRINITY_DN4741_c0_g1_i5.p7 TRINITY_DN4741_c0_g1~~TRINITY_DN4741_c0_g1_i5.p7  ORF type:complete len:172 (-),score=0.46 TRINITY_DN4741_c0_g1_i5:853-1368(-)
MLAETCSGDKSNFVRWVFFFLGTLLSFVGNCIVYDIDGIFFFFFNFCFMFPSLVMTSAGNLLDQYFFYILQIINQQNIIKYQILKNVFNIRILILYKNTCDVLMEYKLVFLIKKDFGIFFFNVIISQIFFILSNTISCDILNKRYQFFTIKKFRFFYENYQQLKYFLYFQI